MKIHDDDLAHLQANIQSLDTADRRAEYVTTGLSSKRYRWDLLYAAGLSHWICDALYPYMNDDHIDTALRHIVPDLTINA